jgi:RND family efflux transporter MFP subunit
MTLFQPKPAMNSSRHLPAVLAATLGWLATAFANAAEPVPVATVRPTRGDITRYVALPGTLRANQQVTVQARVAGFVKTIAVDRGDRVKAGQVLAEIEVPELLAERTKQLAEVKVAEVEARRLEAGRQKSPDLVTPQALDAAVGRLEVARAELEKTETLLRYANLTAPFAGVVTARFVDAGAFVPAGAAGGASAVVTLADTSVLRAQVPVPEADAVFVKTGQPVRVTVEGMTNVFPATVSRHAGAVDEATRSLLVEADLPNAADLLRPGMFATVRIGVERHTGALLVRTEAIAVEKTANFVFRVDNGVSRKTAVKLGFQDGALTEVLSGITGEAVILVPAKSAPADGAAVRVGEAR